MVGRGHDDGQSEFGRAPAPSGQRIVTPDQRLRVFISADAQAMPAEQAAAVAAVRTMRLIPVALDAGARAHSRRVVSRSYAEQSDVFVGVYGATLGDRDPDDGTPALVQEYRAAHGKPRLIYVMRDRAQDASLRGFLDEIASTGEVSYRPFGGAAELQVLIADDLAVLLTERFSGGDGAGTPPGLPEVGPSPRRLPATPNSFVDRHEELATTTALLRDPQVRVVTLVGPGGVGKTRLALEAGRAVADDFPDGSVVLWLDGLADPGFLLQALGAELHVKERRDRPLLESIGDHLRGVRMLIVLDNFEHVIAAASQVADVAALPTASTFLVTSRELLHIRGERVVDVGGLPVPEDDAGVADSGAADAVRLFVDRATAAAGGFALTPDNARDVTAIVRRLEGLPLAIELAAARVRLLPPGALLQRLAHPLDLPAVGGRDLPSRQRTLRTTIQWSYELLDADEQRALQRMSVFAGGASLDAATALLADLPDPLNLVEALLDKSLLRRIATARAEPRLTMLAAIRDFAAEQLEGGGEAGAARDLHAGYYTTLTQGLVADLHSQEQVRCLVALDEELENLQAALEWLYAQRRADASLTLANHLRWYWILRGHLSAADRWLQRLLELPGGSVRVRGEGATTAGMIALEAGDAGRAHRLFEQAVADMTQAGDRDGLAWARTGLGGVMAANGDHAAAAVLQEQALEVFRAEEDLLGQCTANTRMALLTLSHGDYATAEQQFHESLTVRRKIRDPWGTSYVLTELGAVRLLADDYEQAQRYLEEALGLVRQIGYEDGIARVLVGLGVIAAASGKWQGALRKFEDARRLYDRVGNHGGRAQAVAYAARAHVELGAADTAARCARDAYAAARAVVAPQAAAAAADALAAAAAAGGDAVAAAQLLGHARQLRAAHRLVQSPQDPLGPGRRVAELVAGLDAAEAAGWQRRGAALSDEQVATLTKAAQAEHTGT